MTDEMKQKLAKAMMYLEYQSPMRGEDMTPQEHIALGAAAHYLVQEVATGLLPENASEVFAGADAVVEKYYPESD